MLTAVNTPEHNTLRGEAAAVVSTLFFSLMAVMVKLSAGQLSGIQIAFFRFVIGGALSLAGILVFRQKLRPSGWFPVLMRALLGSVSMIIYYHAIGLTSGGRATLLNNLYPFFVALFGGLFFRERLRPVQLLFMLVSFAGTAVIFWDGSHYPLAGNLLALASALIVGLSVNFMKLARESNNSFLLYFWICLFGTLFTIPFMVPALPLLPELPPTDWLLVSGAAVVVFVAQMLFTWGQKYITAVRNSAISFLKLPLTIVLSFFLLGEVMTRRFWVGFALVAAGLLLDTFITRRLHGQDRSLRHGPLPSSDGTVEK